MFSIARNALSTKLLAAALTIGAASAQTLDGKVERNPEGTVTYTIDLDGPPRGTGYVFLGIGAMPMPLPTPFGPLFLNPGAMFLMGSVALDDLGQGTWRTTVGAGRTLNAPLYFQSLYLDRGILQTSLNYACLLHGGDRGDAPGESFAVGWGGGDAGFQVWGTPGDRYSIQIIDAAGNVVGHCIVMIGPDNKSPFVRFPIGAPLGPGLRWSVAKDIGQGHVLPRWRGNF